MVSTLRTPFRQRPLSADPRFIWTILIALAMLVSAPTQAQTLPSGFNDALVMGGWTNPVGVTFDANDRWYVWEKRGMVWIVENGVKRTTPLIDISQEVGNWRDHGFLGFVLDPNYLSNGYIYMLYAVDRHHLMNFGTGSYNPATNAYYEATIMRITRYTAIAPDHNVVDYNSRLVLFGETPSTGAPMTHESHSTGSLVFGDDGTLLASLGDGASYSSTDVGSAGETYWSQAIADGIMRPEENVGALRSQMLGSFNGKVIRIDPATGDGIPSNPFYNAAAPRSSQSRTWALGLRNPYRMTIREGSGSSDPALADPGTLYIGDVGWALWEDLNVCTEGGMNFGWPIFEGMLPHSTYSTSHVYNQDTPNPLYNGTSCTQQYFYFQDLLKQDTPNHLNQHPNPCNTSVQIPNTVPKFIHARPAIDWRHGSAQARCGAFNGSTAVTYLLNDPNSPVPGPVFNGNAALGGPTIAGTGWPVGYQNVNMSADYVGGWIRRFVMNANDQPVSVHDFASNLGYITWLGEGPDGCVWYINYSGSSIRKICPTGVTNLPPAAVATQDVQYGPGPLTVNFTGSGSSDPEMGALTYDWDFGDGFSSTLTDPSHTFNAPPGVPTTYTVTLTVTDPQLATNSAQLIVSLNNTPPSVVITSFPDSLLYPIGVDTLISLQASVSDAEHTGAQLTYAWQTTLHHNVHTHPEPVDNDPVSSTLISGVGCYDEEYHYEVDLTVTDAGGLSTKVTHRLYPNCAAIAPVAVMYTNVSSGLAPLLVSFDGTNSYDPGEIVSYAWDFGDGNFATGSTANHTYTAQGAYNVSLTVTDDDGLTAQATGVITVIGLDPPQCVGPIGSIKREYWNGISGSAVSDLTNNASYPNDPSGSNNPTSFQGPNGFGDNYGTRMRGYIVPQETGNFIFNITSDDASVLYLSPNADPQFKTVIASVAGWTGPTEFSKYASQRSSQIYLQAGVHYYVEMLQKEGGGGDHLAVYWERPSNSTLTLISGSFLAPWVDCPPSVTVNTLLDGPYDTGTDRMHDDLRTQALIPSTEPFTALGFAHAGGGGGETVPAAILQETGDRAIVDWVLIELRNATTPTSIVATRSALLRRNGEVTGTDGYRRILFSVAAGNYHVAVRHRNHLGVMTFAPLSLDKNEKLLDLTLPGTATYGTDARVMTSTGRMAQWCGNVIVDGSIKYTGNDNDRDAVLVEIGGSVPTNTTNTYSTTDVNLDGLTKYTGLGNDRDRILITIGGTTPTVVRTEQLP